jgi:hypothetical protein
MKKIILLCSVLMLTVALTTKPEISAGQITAVVCKAMDQTGTVKTYDTTVNTDTTYLEMFQGTTPMPITTWADVICSWTNTTLSGSTGGSFIFQGSETGAFLRTAVGDWETLVNDKVGSLVTDTVTVSGTTHSDFIISNCRYKYVRGRYISSGTQTSTPRMTCYVKPH